jgi:hypothetical protein
MRVPIKESEYVYMCVRSIDFESVVYFVFNFVLASYYCVVVGELAPCFLGPWDPVLFCSYYIEMGIWKLYFPMVWRSSHGVSGTYRCWIKIPVRYSLHKPLLCFCGKQAIHTICIKGQGSVVFFFWKHTPYILFEFIYFSNEWSKIINLKYKWKYVPFPRA